MTQKLLIIFSMAYLLLGTLTYAQTGDSQNTLDHQTVNEGQNTLHNKPIAASPDFHLSLLPPVFEKSLLDLPDIYTCDPGPCELPPVLDPCKDLGLYCEDVVDEDQTVDASGSEGQSGEKEKDLLSSSVAQVVVDTNQQTVNPTSSESQPRKEEEGSLTGDADPKVVADKDEDKAVVDADQKVENEGENADQKAVDNGNLDNGSPHNKPLAGKPDALLKWKFDSPKRLRPNPVDPIPPIDPIEPVEPIKPIKPIKPIDPIDPIGPTDPIY